MWDAVELIYWNNIFFLIWTIHLQTRLHPQGKGGPKATFCVRRTKSSQFISDIFWRYIPNLNAKSYQLLATNCWFLKDRAWQKTETRTETRTYGRTNIDFFGPPYTKSPFGAIIVHRSFCTKRSMKRLIRPAGTSLCLRRNMDVGRQTASDGK